MYMNKFLACIVIAAMLAGCGHAEQEQEERPIDYNAMREDLIKQNKVWHNEELVDIDAFARRHQWNVTISGTGLRYVIYQKADTTLPTAKEGQIARVNYTITMLNDSLCYSSEGKPDDFLIGMDNVESGLHEGVTYMRKGEKAKIILSSNLAFGLVGDMDQVPPQTPLVYDIELVDILEPAKKPAGK